MENGFHIRDGVGGNLAPDVLAHRLSLGITRVFKLHHQRRDALEIVGRERGSRVANPLGNADWNFVHHRLVHDRHFRNHIVDEEAKNARLGRAVEELRSDSKVEMPASKKRFAPALGFERRRSPCFPRS